MTQQQTATAVRALSTLEVGEAGRVHGFTDACPPEIRRRLASLGFIHGAEVNRLRRAPLGDPSVYRVMNYDICLRNHEARYIECKTVGE